MVLEGCQAATVSFGGLSSCRSTYLVTTLEPNQQVDPPSYLQLFRPPTTTNIETTATPAMLLEGL